MYVNAGELNKRIEIIRLTSERDPDGYEAGQKETVVRTCWAKFSRTSGSESLKSGADFGTEKSRFLVRASRIPVDRKMIVRYRGRDYPIVYVNEYGDSGEYLEILCERRRTDRVL